FGISYVFPFLTICIALSNALYAEFDLGDRQSSTTITDKGILPSGNPNLSTDSTTGKTRAQTSGFANPISSQAITSNRRQIDIISPPSNKRAKYYKAACTSLPQMRF